MDPNAPTVKTIQSTIKTTSVTTDHKKRDARLRGLGFFDIEKYP